MGMYIKDMQADALARQLAAERGLTKTAAVKLALTNELAKTAPRTSLVEIARELRRTSTLPPANVAVADRTFFDNLYDE